MQERNAPIPPVSSPPPFAWRADGCPVVSVKTASDIPKGKIADCVRALKDVKVKAPVHIGDVILENAAGTGVNIIATKDVL